jgi:predicted TIM-barrel fold metal-dependent hydrolase
MVAYPSLGIAASSFEDPAFAEAFARRWNRWAARFADASPGRRLRAVGIVPLQDPARAVRVLDEVGALGLVAVTVPPCLRDGRNLDHPSLDAFWEAVASSGLPAGVHGAPGMHVPVAGADRFDNYVQVHALSFPFDQMIALTALTLGGVLERHARLRVAFLEAGVGWVPYFLERLDEHVEKRGRQVPGCRRPPSEYAARGQCVFSCEPEEHGIAHAVDALGAGTVMYASDYPHWDSDFPHTVAPIRDRPDLSVAAKACGPRQDRGRVLPNLAPLLLPRRGAGRLDDPRGVGRGGLVGEAEGRGELPPDHLRDQEGDVDPAVGQTARDAGPEPGTVVALDEEARDVRRRGEAGLLRGGRRLLPAHRVELDRRPVGCLREPVAHHETEIRAGCRERLEGPREHAGLVRHLGAPERDPFDRDRHGVLLRLRSP